MRLKRHVEYRRYGAIDNSRFAADLAASDLNAPELDPTALLFRYDSCIRTIVDAHAPLVSWTITVRPMTYGTPVNWPKKNELCAIGDNQA